MVQTVLPDTSASIAERSASTSTCGEYTTRWWWGEPDLRSIASVDRDCRRRRHLVGRAVCGAGRGRVQPTAGRERGHGARRRRGWRCRRRVLGAAAHGPLAAGQAVLLPRPPARHPGAARDARAVERHADGDTFRPALVARREGDGPSDDPVQERSPSQLQTGGVRAAAHGLSGPDRPAPRRPEAPGPAAGVRLGPRPDHIAGRGRGADRTPPLIGARAIMIAPVRFEGTPAKSRRSL